MKKDNPYQHQNDPQRKEHYNTDGFEIEIDIWEMLKIEDFFGDKPTDVEIQNYKMFCYNGRDGRVSINPFNPNVKGWRSEIIKGIKKVILKMNQRQINNLTKEVN